MLSCCHAGGTHMRTWEDDRPTAVSIAVSPAVKALAMVPGTHDIIAGTESASLIILNQRVRADAEHSDSEQKLYHHVISGT